MTLSYNEMKLLLTIIMVAIENGNRATGKAFDPTPDQYEMCCEVANRLEENINRMQTFYGLD